MRTIEVTATVPQPGLLTAIIPADIALGPHHVVLVLDEPTALPLPLLAGWETYSSAITPPSATFSREMLYDDREP